MKHLIEDADERKRVEGSDEYINLREALKDLLEGKLEIDEAMTILGYYVAWKLAICDALDTNWIPFEIQGAQPTDCLYKLVESEVQIALDPAVSSDAEKLIEKGRQKAIAEMERAKVLRKTINPQTDFVGVTDAEVPTA